MAFFRHTIDNYIIINNGGSDLIMPLSFFVTQEAAYAIPVGAVWQEYQQGIAYYSSDGITSTNYSIPWTTGNGYITNFTTYQTNYNAYLTALTLPQTLTDAKIYQINLLKKYAFSTIKNSGIIINGITYQTYEGYYDRWKNDNDYAVRNAALLGSYYVTDISGNPVSIGSVADFTIIIDALDKFNWIIQQNYDAHVIAINLLGTIGAVLAYDYTTGWPIMPYSADLTFYASYSAIINADFAVGSAVGTATGGANILNNYLDLAHGDARYVDYNATANADSQQVGYILAEDLKPNYSGAPASDQVFICITKADVDSTNLIQLTHKITTGNLQLTIKDQSDSAIATINFGAWTPVSGTNYKIAVYYDITSGNNWISINDIQFGTINTSTGTRSATIGLLRIGSGYNSGSAETSNFSIKKLHISSQ